MLIMVVLMINFYKFCQVYRWALERRFEPAQENEFSAACGSPASSLAYCVLYPQWPACSNALHVHQPFPVYALISLSTSIRTHVKDQGHPLGPAHNSHSVFLVSHWGNLHCVAMVAFVAAAAQFRWTWSFLPFTTIGYLLSSLLLSSSSIIISYYYYYFKDITKSHF